MLGSGDPTPYDLPALVFLVICAAILLAGSAVGGGWSPRLASGLRRGPLVAATAVMAAVLVVTPTRDGIVGAGRMLTIWPAFALVAVLFIVWTLRAGRL